MTKLERAKAAQTAAEERQRRALDSLEAAADDISDEDLAGLNSEFDEADAELDRSKATVTREERIAAARAALPAPVAGQTITVVKNEATYRPDTTRSWFKDVFASRTGNREALERLYKNDEEVREDMQKREVRTNANGSGFLPPVYLGDEWADFPHAGRPFASTLPDFQLAESGVTYTIPKLTSPTGVAIHTDGGSSVQDTAAVTNTVSHTLVAIAGQNEIDRVVLEKSYPGMDMVIFRDLQQVYDVLLDQQLYTGTGTGQHLGLDHVSGINTVSLSTATQVAALVSIYQGISKVMTSRFLPPDLIVMHPRRATWFAAGTDTAFPIFNQGGLNMFQVGEQSKGIVGSIAGLPVIVDANVPTTKGASTNQDTIYVLRTADMLLGEDPVRTATFEEVSSNDLAIRLQLWGYSLAALDRYAPSICAIDGTGLVAPTGF